MKSFALFLSEAPRSIWYHGSNIKNLHSILKQGLIPNKKVKEWGNDQDAKASFHSPSLATYGGVYVAKNFSTAASAPRESANHFVVVVMELQPNTFYLDEDAVVGLCSNPIGHLSQSDHHIGLYWLMLQSKEQRYVESLDHYRESFEAKFLQGIKQQFTQQGRPLTDQLKKRLHEMLPVVWEASLGRIAAQVAKHLHPYEYKKALSGVYGDKYWNEEPPAMHDMFLTVSAAEANFRKAAEQLTKTLRLLAYPGGSEIRSQFATARISTPVGYSGSNRILAVLEVSVGTLQDGGWHRSSTTVTVRYGSVPAETKDQIEKQYKNVEFVNSETES